MLGGWEEKSSFNNRFSLKLKKTYNSVSMPVYSLVME
jgi:hypothetical protein